MNDFEQQKHQAAMARANEELRAEVADGKRVEGELRYERDFTSAILDTMGALVVVLDNYGRIVRFNRASERITGYSFEEVHNKTVWPLLLAPEQVEMVRLVFADVLAGQFPNHLENDWVTRDGSRRRIAWSNTAMLGEAGVVEYVIGIGIDITARKQAEEALRSAEQRLELAVDAAQMGIFDRDVKTGRTVWSDRLAKLFGLTLDEFGGTYEHFIQLLHPDDRDSIDAKLRRAQETGEECVMEHRVIWPDGSLHWIEARGRMPHAGSDRFVGTAIDITQRKIAQEQLLKHREQLRSLASQLSLTEERERRGIARNLHDSIGQNLALARLKLGDRGESGTAAREGRQLDQARDLIEQALSSVQSLTYELSPPILYDLGLEAALEWLGEQFQQQHGLKVVFTDDRQPKPVREELRFLLFRAARELLVNVVKHAGARAAKLSVCRRDHHLELTVEDDGKGFATPPGNASDGITPDRGGGFGLFSIRERVEHLGGRLDIASPSGAGTRAAVVVPLQPRSGSEDDARHNTNIP